MIKRFISYYKPHKTLFFIDMVFAFILAACDLFYPVLAGEMLDRYIPEGMLKASQFVEAVQDRQGFYVSCIEEIAWRRGFITTKQLRELGESLKMTDYGQYLLSLATEE